MIATRWEVFAPRRHDAFTLLAASLEDLRLMTRNVISGRAGAIVADNMEQ
jgi:hypothetical protein